MKAFIAMLSLMTLLFAYPALAELPHEGLGFRGPGSEGGRLLERLIDPTGTACRTSCFEAARNCRDTAEATLLTSVGQNDCQKQTQNAQSACAVDRTSQPCQDARSALRSCAQHDLMTLRTTLRGCRNTAEMCVDACNSPQ
jgi:hypothetical protein